MKTIIKSIYNLGIAVLLIALGSVSCKKSFLEKRNPNDITAGAFFETPDQIQQAVNTLYPAIGGVRSIFEQNSRGGDATLTSGAFDLQIAFFNFQSTPESGDTDGLWEQIYAMIYRANTILANLDRADWTDNEEMKQRLNAETLYFRGIGYFYLAFLFGQVPIVTKPAETEEDYNPAKATSVDEVYDQAIADLTAAKDGLPVEQEDKGRATKGAATAFLGKTFLYRAGYLAEDEYKAQAAAQFKEVMDLGIYHLVDNYEDNFTDANENNEESIFELQYGFNGGIGTQTQDRTFNMVPGISFEIFLRPSQWLMQTMGQEKTAGGEFDPRFLQTVYFDGGLPLFGVPYDQLGDGISCDGGSGVGGAPDGSSSKEGGWWRKYLNVNYGCEPAITEGRGSENNERLMRYADVLLMYAEAIADADPAAANAALTEVRDRANLPVETFSGPALMAEIRHQRVMEFSYESMYYFDLIRWGILGQELQDHGTDPQIENYDAVKHKYFPIPTSEINNNTNLEQNDPWK